MPVSVRPATASTAAADDDQMTMHRSDEKTISFEDNDNAEVREKTISFGDIEFLHMRKMSMILETRQGGVSVCG